MGIQELGGRVVADVRLRPAVAADQPAVLDVVRQAFGGRDEEPALVGLIQERGEAHLATVAEVEGEVVGYVLASPLRLEPPQPLQCLAIAPVAVVPARQREGIGIKLMQHAIEAARAQGVDALFLLGHPAYYPRFGFARTHIRNAYGATDAFMALELREGCLQGIDATARYVKAFAEVGA
jgi:putative acetyltransferase